MYKLFGREFLLSNPARRTTIGCCFPPTSPVLLNNPPSFQSNDNMLLMTGGPDDHKDSAETFFRSTRSIELLALLVSVFFVITVASLGDHLFVQAPATMNIQMIDADALLESERAVISSY